MNAIINIFEIAFFLMLPIVIFYLKSSWNARVYLKIIPVLYVLWFLTYALFHELSHMIGGLLIGAEIYEYRLIPYFWKGDFKTAYVHTNYKNNFEEFFIVVFPYVRDIVFLIIGYYILRKKTIKNAFIIGLVLVFFIVSPLFDIINNYSLYLFGVLNDFNALKIASSKIVSNLIGISFSFFALLMTIRILQIYQGYPSNKEIDS